MGTVLGSRRTNSSFNGRIPTEDRWLQNRTFHIHEQNYTLTDRRGGGSFGSVWAAIGDNGRPAAIKIFNLRQMNRGMDQASIVKSFKAEISMAFRMREQESHVVYIYGFDFDPRTHLALIAMELGEDSLEQRAKALFNNRTRRTFDGSDFIPARDRKNFWKQLVEIILTLKRFNIVHRDIKPANLVFFGPVLKIVDLGIAQKAISGVNTGNLIGTKFYSAPECLKGGYAITPVADIWSAGAVLYYMTYGDAPRSETSRPPPRNSPQTRSSLVHDVIHRCLQQNPRTRASHRWIAEHRLTTSAALE